MESKVEIEMTSFEKAMRIIALVVGIYGLMIAFMVVIALAVGVNVPSKLIIIRIVIAIVSIYLISLNPWSTVKKRTKKARIEALEKRYDEKKRKVEEESKIIIEKERIINEGKNGSPILRADFMSYDETLGDSSKPLDSLMINFDDEIAFNNNEEGYLKQDEYHYKELHNNIPIFLKSHDIDRFYHFTDIENLESIIKNGGLYSWKGLEKKGIIASMSSNELSRQLDRRHNLQDYVRLSFTHYHPMSTKVEKQDGKKLIWLEINLDVAQWKSTLFSDMNATDNNVKFDDSFDFLKTLDFSVYRQQYSNLDDLGKKKYQTEILVKDFLPIKYIKNIDELKEKYLDYDEILFKNT